MTSATPLLELGAKPFVSLTTFRKTGEGVPTPVWIARDGDALLVTTSIATGKVKRIRNNSAVELRTSNMRRVVDESVPATTAQALIVDDPAEVARCNAHFLAKYGIQYRIITWFERRRQSEQTRRVILRIS